MVIWIAIGIVLVGGAFVLTGMLQDTVTQETAERVIERTTNGAADVNVGNQSVTVTTNASTIEAGEDVDVPEGFPDDVYVIAGTITSVVTVHAGTTIVIQNDVPVADANTEYTEKLETAGWRVTGNGVFGDTASLFAQKDGRAVSIGISRSGETTTVTVTVTVPNA